LVFLRECRGNKSIGRRKEESESDMDTLPVELVSLIIACCPIVVQPLAAFVCRGWSEALKRHRNLLPAPDLAHFYRSLPYDHMCCYVPHCRRAQDADYRNRLANAKRAAYACRLVKTGHRALIEWAFEEGGFEVTARVLSKAAATGDLDLVKRLLARYKGNAAAIDVYRHIARGAAKVGSISVLEWAHVGRNDTIAKGAYFEAYKSAIATAARHNQREAIQWLRAHGHVLSEKVSTVAAAAGHVDLVFWLRDERCPLYCRVSEAFADRFNPSAFDWFCMHSHYIYRLAYPERVPGDCLARLVRVHAKKGWINSEAWLFAAERGDMVLCEWLLTIDCARTRDAFAYAVVHRQLDTALWLRDHGFESQSRHFATYAERGDIEALDWLSHHGFDLDGDCMGRAAASQGHTDVLEWLLARDPPMAFDNDSAAMLASHAGEWNTVQWLCDRGYVPNNPDMCCHAIKSERTDMLKYLRARGCPWDKSSCIEAAQTGQLETLQWLRAHGCPWTVHACTAAIYKHHYPIADWALDNGCPFDARVCTSAALAGNLYYLKHLRQRGIPWNAHTCLGAVRGGHLETLQWAVANGCPHSLEDCRSLALELGVDHIVDWINGLSLALP